MFSKKELLKKVVTLGLVASTMVCTPVMAATNNDAEAVDEANGIVKTVTKTENGTVIEGMVSLNNSIGFEDTL